MEIPTSIKAHNFTLYRSLFGFGKWRWRIKARNGKIIAASTQGYTNKGMAEYNAKSTAASIVKEFNL